MNQFGERIRQMLKERGISQAQLARMIQVKQQTISYICAPSSPATSSRYTHKIAAALGVNAEWLQTGEGSPTAPSIPSEASRTLPVPVVAPEYVNAYLSGDFDTMSSLLLMTDVKVGGQAFALERHDLSMEPKIKSGDRLLIDPDVPAIPGDLVCAKFGDEILIRRYRKRPDGFDLVPINEDWPTLSCSAASENLKVLGVVVEHRSYRRT